MVCFCLLLGFGLVGDADVGWFMVVDNIFVVIQVRESQNSLFDGN